MSQFLSEKLCPAASWGRLGMLLTFLLVSAAPASAQTSPSRSRPPEYTIKDLDRDMKEAAGHDPSSARFIWLFKSWAGLAIIAVAVVALAVVFRVVVWFFTPSSDLVTLAENDPWVRAQLAQEEEAGDAPPDPTP
jgi:hypothetical protein